MPAGATLQAALTFGGNIVGNIKTWSGTLFGGPSDLWKRTDSVSNK